MIWKIAKKEFLLNLMTFKFAVGTTLCAVLMAVFMPILAKDYQRRLGQYNEAATANEAELRKVKVYKNITPTVYRRPSVLSVFNEGLEKRLGNSAKIEFESVPEINMALSEDNPFLSIFPAMDVSLIFKIVVSILALLVAYDVISGERERGTLKLILSGTLPRYQILLGKLLAGLITLAIPITIAFIIGVLILEFSPMVDLNGSDWARVGLVYIASLIFIAAMYNLGLLFSCLTRKSAISLMWVLLFWVVFVVIIPNISIRLSNQIHPLQPREMVDSQVEIVQGNLRMERRKLAMSLYHAGKSKPAPGRVVSGGAGAFGGNYAKMVSKSYVEERIKRQAFPLKIKYADEVWKIELNYLNDLLKQKQLASRFMRVSPTSLYDNVISAISGSDLAGFQYFVDRTRIYRNQVIDYIRTETDNFTLPSTITACSEEDMRQCDVKYARYTQAQNEAEEKDAREAWWKWVEMKVASQPTLDLQDLPKFVYLPSVTSGLQGAIFDLGLLLAAGAFFFVLSFVVFVRYDVRSD
jgi:ABC-type transport system involved in multi-copper enzyme maturation permease subunit